MIREFWISTKRWFIISKFEEWIDICQSNNMTSTSYFTPTTRSISTHGRSEISCKKFLDEPGHGNLLRSHCRKFDPWLSRAAAHVVRHLVHPCPRSLSGNRGRLNVERLRQKRLWNLHDHPQHLLSPRKAVASSSKIGVAHFGDVFIQGVLGFIVWSGRRRTSR